jgi:hypothetical protein
LRQTSVDANGSWAFSIAKYAGLCPPGSSLSTTATLIASYGASSSNLA